MNARHRLPFIVEVPPNASVGDWYAAYYEKHSEEEQIKRLEGDDDKEKAHHWAVVLIIRAMTAEGVPT